MIDTTFCGIFSFLYIYFCGDGMFKGILRKSEILQEYVGELKVTYQNKTLSVINYEKIYSIDFKEVILEELKIEGTELKVIYQDKVKITIKGNISNVIKRG